VRGLLALLIVLAGSGAAAAVTAAEPAAALPAPVQLALARAGLPASALGLVAVPLQSPAGAGLRWQADLAMPPSSTIKILSAAVALDQLGPASRGRSEILADPGPLPADGRLAGPLYLRGGADAQLDWGALWLMLRQLRELGLREVPAGLVLDRSLFRPARPDAGQPAFDEYPDAAYNVIPDALLLNGNLLGLSLQSDAQGAVTARLSPAWPGVTVDASGLRPAERPCADWEKDWQRPRVQPRPDGGLLLQLQGSFPRQCRQQAELSLLDRQDLLDQAVRGLWRELGGSLGPRTQNGSTPPQAQLLAQHQDRPLGELLRQVLKSSDNPLARLVYLRLGAALAGPQEETLVAAERGVRAWLAARGIADTGLVLENGSGLSRRERMPARLLAEVLAAIWASPQAPELISGLPLAGVDGTLRRRLKGTAAEGRARLKTGSLRDVVALAGYVPDGQGRHWVLVAWLNHEQALQQGRPVLDALVDWVARQ